MLRVVPSVPKYIVIQKICLWCLMNELRNLTFHCALARGSVWHILPHSILMVTLWRNGSLERFYDLLRAMQLDGVRNQAQFSEFRVHITAAHEAPRCIFRKMLVSRVLLFKSSGAKESESKKFCKWVIRWNCCWWSGLTHALLPRCVCADVGGKSPRCWSLPWGAHTCSKRNAELSALALWLEPLKVSVFLVESDHFNFHLL